MADICVEKCPEYLTCAGRINGIARTAIWYQKARNDRTAGLCVQYNVVGLTKLPDLVGLQSELTATEQAMQEIVDENVSLKLAILSMQTILCEGPEQDSSSTLVCRSTGLFESRHK